MTYAVGALVRARGREWVVLPNSTDDLLLVRPLGGTNVETAGILTGLEPVEPASFALPDPSQTGDFRSARLLRDAVRLGFRASAGPFRSFARINVEPRPYQLVPLLLALKLDPVRLLIADDVGIGKTIEAALIARELIDRGEIDRLAVLCPPHLAEQWQAELASKFHIDAELVLSSTASRLERGLRIGETLFEHHPYVVVSTDFIKSERRRNDFVRTCPDFVIVDEAHTVAHTTERGKGRHQRYELVADLAKKPDRHLILVTATPHSGKEDAFRSLLALLNPEFSDLPADLSGPSNEANRRELARYFVQRRRADIRAYMDAETPFPERQSAETSYKLSEPYRHLFERVLKYAREVVQEPGEGYRQRVRWWSALALLRSLASSPAAAAATLRSRAATVEAETEADVDEIGRRTVLDVMTDESTEGMDLIPGSDIGEAPGQETSTHRRLQDMAREADRLSAFDEKLNGVIALVKELMKDGYSPILFCRFIPTVEYVTEALRQNLRGVEVSGVTGLLAPAERETRVQALMEHPRRVLVCTDCLSEGINLQDGFDAVIHYDLSWNPTRHEQREGRVDRYGQAKKTVKVVTYYGIDNQIDGIVLDVLLRKHKTIRDSLGVSVPVPGDTNQVIEAIFEGLLLREDSSFTQTTLPGFEAFMKPQQIQLNLDWDAEAERENRSRTMFAQRTIRVEEVAAELNAARDAVGSGVDVERFMSDAVRMLGGVAAADGAVRFDLTETPRALRDRLGVSRFDARFELPVKDGQLYLTRTHPLVESTAAYVMDAALDPVEDVDLGGNLGAIKGWKARRCGVIRTREVDKRTTLLLVRFRYHLVTTIGGESRQLLAEDSQILAFEGSPENAVWLQGEGTSERIEALLNAAPDENSLDAMNFIERVVNGHALIAPHLDEVAKRRGDELLEAHRRVRAASNRRGVRYNVEPQLPPDVLGIYVYLPVRVQR